MLKQVGSYVVDDKRYYLDWKLVCRDFDAQ